MLYTFSRSFLSLCSVVTKLTSNTPDVVEQATAGDGDGLTVGWDQDYRVTAGMGQQRAVRCLLSMPKCSSKLQLAFQLSVHFPLLAVHWKTVYAFCRL